VSTHNPQHSEGLAAASPAASTETVEQMITRTGADSAPRVVPAALADEIASVHYFTAADALVATGGPADEIPGPLRLLTFCVLVLRNGYTVHGVSACASPDNYRREVGERIARENAERQIWPLLGFRLRDKLSAAPTPALYERIRIEFNANQPLRLVPIIENDLPDSWVALTHMHTRGALLVDFLVPAGAGLPGPPWPLGYAEHGGGRMTIIGRTAQP
jgi:hypothetical protein